MTNYFRTELDINTGEERKIDLTPEEIEKLEATKAEHFAMLAQIQAKETEKLNVLSKLGVTEDEAKLLLS